MSSQHINPTGELKNAEKITVLKKVRDKRVQIYNQLRESFDVIIGSDAVARDYTAKTADSVKKAVERGVEVKLIFNLTKDNAENVKEYVKAGAEVRHYPVRGYLLRVMDKRFVMIEFVDPVDKDFRPSILFDDKEIAGIYTSLFNHIWENAHPIRFNKEGILCLFKC